MATFVVLGGTGNLGKPISTLLEEYKDAYPVVRFTTRDPASAKAKELVALGAHAFAFSDTLDTLFAGAAVVANILPTSLETTLLPELVPALIRNGVQVFFTSEFGNDLRKIDFPGYEHPDWAGKLANRATAIALAKGSDLAVIPVASGVFMPWAAHMSIDWATNSTVGFGAGKRMAMTDFPDIARTLARLGVLARDPATRASVPSAEEGVRIASQFITSAEVVEAVKKAKGVDITVKPFDATQARETLKAIYPPKEVSAFVLYAGVLVEEGLADYSADCHNELVNPGEKLWKWKTFEELLRSA
ncbi:uncharacterized protein BXZ73DRAFT_53087 [Epithele typhae]|uniref:uncharacterized protein n=1 Tax=Epithele typhae TaxID=378194 RepID=UPI002007DFAD|nr:uncharacterized protein BXZ73DRAFT_53087 [Epithele typhae]KAH9918186.1 hypothetical protein BXZ73DRAFT_53087 [Epithele typhae]